MKLRIRGNSVRIRLTRSEVARLGEGSRIEQVTHFSPTSSLRSSVEPATRVAAPVAEFDNEWLSVLLPVDQVQRWANSDQVTIDAKQEVEPGTVLQILVEKDFECVHSRAEGSEDAFPNPRHVNSVAGGFRNGAASAGSVVVRDTR